MLELAVKNDERIAVIGQTKMGKTFLMERLLADQPRIIVVDSKERVRWKGFHLTRNPHATLLADKVIFRPDERGGDNANRGGVPPDWWWRAALDSLSQRGGGIIYIDELPVVVTANRIPGGLADLYRVGSELGVGVFGSAQESTTIHNTTLRQCDQIILFYNQGASDRDKVTDVVGDMGETTGFLGAYQFVVFVRGETYDKDSIPVYQVIP